VRGLEKLERVRLKKSSDDSDIPVQPQRWIEGHGKPFRNKKKKKLNAGDTAPIGVQ
jgi:hypothetical protein